MTAAVREVRPPEPGRPSSPRRGTLRRGAGAEQQHTAVVTAVSLTVKSCCTGHVFCKMQISVLGKA